MRERVLVVDDSKPVCQFLTDRILKPRNFDVVVAHDGAKGLELALNINPDLVITDNQMPGLTGLQILHNLRDKNIQIPAILMTALGSEKIAVEAFRLGIRDYVIKPFEAEDMHRAIDRALREARLERERDELTKRLVASNTQLQRRLQEFNTLYGISKSVSASLDLEEVIQRVVEAAVYVTGAEEGTLFLHDASTNELYVRASKNMESGTRSVRLPVEDSLVGQVFRTRKPLVIDDDARWQKIKTSYLVKSLMYVPLIGSDQAIGVLGVANRERSGAFDKSEVRILSLLADYTVIAIRNANLFSQSEQERNKLNTILAQTLNPVMVVDNEARLVMANQSARRALKMPDDDIIGLPLIHLIDDTDTLDFLRQSPEEDWHPSTEISAAQDRVYSANISLIEGVGRSIVMHDITQLKELDQLKSEFVSVVSHDLRSPLTSILGYVELMSRAGTLTETQLNFVERIKGSVASITALINDLLDLGRLESGIDMHMLACQPTVLLQRIIEELQPKIQGKRLKLTMNVPDTLPTVFGDEQRLHQALNNVIGNAVKYTPAGGAIEIRTEEQQEQLVIHVSDSGIGIEPVDQPHIFDKFFRAENAAETGEGTGLGLSIVKSVVERHNGRIWVSSTPNEGTTFSIVLPILGDGPTQEEIMRSHSKPK